MRKSLILLVAAICMSLAACNKDNDTDSTSTAKVHVSVNDFSISQEDFPGTKTGQDVADYNGVKVMVLAFYKADGTEQYKTTQLRSDSTTFTTFGEFDLSLPMGSYTMVVIGHGLNTGEPAITLTSPTAATFGTNPARETFVTTQAVNISSTNALDISATLNRVVSKLQVASSDTRTAPAQSVRMTFAAGGKSFNPTTGLATDNTGFSNAVITSTAVGVASLSNSYLFLATDEQTMDVTIETLDEDGNVVFSKTVQNVPFKRNRVTKLTGAMYTNSGVSGGFLVETDWLDQYEGTF